MPSQALVNVHIARLNHQWQEKLDQANKMPHQKRNNLLNAAKAFCNAFAAQAPLEDILSYFSTQVEISAHEHGLKHLAPFLGRTYKGRKGIEQYFDLLQKHLSYKKMRFSNYIVDAAENRVSVKGEAKFIWTATGQGWDEVFTYQLAFDEDLKVISYDVWADTGAAYLASKGTLEDVKSE